ncbi:30S ribosomal protein S13 [Candidatus Woesebacteria bacterium GWA1_41_8]|jgi:small subunit ribosomal protein S13|uniref:Small ribosomal subunit protein uS13 n=1 Tax=Candidatus Woesebacteria bacterium GWA1_41_8 TaxID=1802471 RepID=A0A1F7WJR5_9BACT|nr:MAG: 30S ribosomal protein S13 [Candidatus Woesebacteria bacterium GWA1_41_8]
MARISGVELQDNWKVDYALTRIKGIGWSIAEQILKKANLPSSKRLSELSSDEVAKLASEVDKYPTEGELLRQVKSNVTRLHAIGSYRGVRHSRGLPVRGQRTRTNARTKRGKRRTVGAFKKEALTKMQQTQKGEK